MENDMEDEIMNLAQFPRKRYTYGNTPIEYLPHFSKALGDVVNIYIKRDDLLGLTAGGNKTRKLEFLMADALQKGADTIITCGAVQSNHCRLTLAAAVKEGLACHLVLEERVKNSYNKDANGNNFLYRLLGADGYKVVDGGSDIMQAMEELAEELKSCGKRPYIIPGGGSNEIGALGYVSCAQEIMGQMFEQGLTFDSLVCASGSAGTHAGLLVGMEGNRMEMPIVGISVNRKKDVQEKVVHGLTQKLIKKLNLNFEIAKSKVTVFDDYVGDGYSLPTKAMVEAVNMLAKTEGILLDPVYTGKAMSGFIDLIRKGYFAQGSDVLFLHTGGSPALYSYTEVINGNTLEWNNR